MALQPARHVSLDTASHHESPGADCLVPSLCSRSVRTSNLSAGWDLVQTDGWFEEQKPKWRRRSLLHREGTFVCYSGLVGSGGTALLRRQLDFLQALKHVPSALRGDIHVALSRAKADGLDRESARALQVNAQLDASGNSSARQANAAVFCSQHGSYGRN